MTDLQEIDLLVQGIKKYADFYGYSLKETHVGPDIGFNPAAIRLIFSGFNSELAVAVDKDDKEFNVDFKLTNKLGNIEFEKVVEGKGTVMDTANDIHKVLKELPANVKKAVNTEESFLQELRKSTRYLVEREYNDLFK